MSEQDTPPPGPSSGRVKKFLALLICIAGLVTASLAANGLRDKKEGCDCTKVKITLGGGAAAFVIGGVMYYKSWSAGPPEKLNPLFAVLLWSDHQDSNDRDSTANVHSHGRSCCRAAVRWVERWLL